MFANVEGGAGCPPVVNVSTEDEIYRNLVEYTSDRRALQTLGVESRRWLLANHDWRTVIQLYVALYNRVLAA